MKVAVLGWYGHGNFGDDLMLEGLRTLFSGCELIVMSDTGRSSYPVFNAELANKCDLLVLGGGELINSDRLFCGCSWVDKVKVPKIILGCGVNAENPKQLKHVVKDLAKFSYIGVRDNTSANILKVHPQLESKVDLFFDLACALKYERHKQKTDYAVVVPTDRFTSKYDHGILQFNTVEKSHKWLSEQLASYRRTVFLPFGQEDNNDFVTAKSLSHYCPNECSVYYHGQFCLVDVLKLISEAVLTVSYRLHGLILAYMLESKYVFYAYHHKLQRVHDTLTGYVPVDMQAIQKQAFKRAMDVLT